MAILENLQPERVFYYFEQMSKIHRGSDDMDAISNFCVDFAKDHNLRYYTDDMKNVVIFKDATKGYENAQPVILQGHLDMVCQKTEDNPIDFLKDGLEIYVDGDFVKAKDTTLGADNGIAVAMVMSILESDSIDHPAIQAVFTTDEETGMYGAKALDMSVLSAKRMINIDSEEDDVITVSCAGGADITAKHKITAEEKCGDVVTITLKGLRGGHSGIEINTGKLNANKLMGETLSDIMDVAYFELLSINGGDKPNAITNLNIAELCFSDFDSVENEVKAVLNTKTDEIKKAEKDACFEIEVIKNTQCKTFAKELTQKTVTLLKNTKNGVIKMSESIENLVETSLNLGIVQSSDSELLIHFSLRSNKNDGLTSLENEMKDFFKSYGFESESFGHYPSWEYRESSTLRDMYYALYEETFNKQPKVEAIHAGLECGVFASKIENFDCIAIGPNIFDAHTVNERLSIKSTKAVYDTIVKLLAKML